VVGAGAGFDARWRASIDGKDLGPPEAIDGGVGWVVRRTGAFSVDVRFPPERVLDTATGLTLVGLAMCGWLLWRR
jgi:arabinofuranan 3-O-arabinosyltransferase